MATRFCNQCGAQLPENTRFCTNCGAAVPPPPQPEPTPSYAQQNYSQPQYQQPQQPQPSQQPIGTKPSSYLVLAILATIFCCLPFGIVGIVQAAKVDNLWNSGQYAAAEDASRKARNWSIAAAITGIVVAIIYMVFVYTLGTSFLDGFDY